MLDVCDRSEPVTCAVVPGTINNGGINDSRAYIPVSTRYIPEHTGRDNHVNPSSQDMPGFQPFLGLRSLSIDSLSTSNVNHARRASASTMVQR